MTVASNSEARKRAQEVAALHVDERYGIGGFGGTDQPAVHHQRRREAVQLALAAVYSGAGFDEADAFLLALEDAGARVEVLS